MNNSQLSMMVGSNENVLWSGKPNKKCFILEGLFNPLLAMALFWLAITNIIMGSFLSSSPYEYYDPFEGRGSFFSIFAIVKFMPAILYLFGVATTFIRYKHLEYIVTDKAIYISRGIFTYTTQMKPLAELSQVYVHRGIIDQIIGVGDVYISCGMNMGCNSNGNYNSSQYMMNICDIENYEAVFKMIKDLQTDIHSDTMYPNAFRPESNSGYNTKYTGKAFDNDQSNDW